MARPSIAKPQASARLYVLPQKISEDTIGCLEALLEEAKRGNIVGLAYAANYREDKFIVDTVGEAYRRPMFTLGMLDLLGHRIRNGE